MKRRQILATGGSVTLVTVAGCSSSGDPETDGAERDGEDVENAAGNDTGADDEVGDGDESTNESEGQSDDVQDDDARENENDDGVDAEEAAARIDEAEAILEDALAEYSVNAGPNASYAAVTAGAEIESDKIFRDLKEAGEILDTAADVATDEQVETIANLEAAAEYIELAVNAEEPWGEALEQAETVMEMVYQEDPGAIIDALIQLDDDLARAEAAIDLLDSQADREAAIASGLVTEAQVDAKDERFRTNLDSGPLLREAVRPLSHDDGLPAWGAGVEEYFGEQNYPAASGEFWTATRQIADAAEAAADPTGAFEPFVDDVHCLASAISEAADHLYDSAEHYIAGDDSDAETALDDAQGALEECDLTSQLDSCQTVLDG